MLALLPARRRRSSRDVQVPTIQADASRHKRAEMRGFCEHGFASIATHRNSD
jgi:hypothetical protein